MTFKELTITFHATDYPILHRLINGALKSCITAHGDINNNTYASAAKRVVHQLAGYTRELNKYERKRQLKQRAMMLFE